MIILVDFDRRGVSMLITICCRQKGNSKINGTVLIIHLLTLCRLLRHVKMVSEVQEQHPKDLLRYNITMIIFLS